MLRKIILFALTSGLAAKLYRDIRAAGASGKAPALKEEIHTWEDEGGALPPAAH